MTYTLFKFCNDCHIVLILTSSNRFMCGSVILQ
jgi:hypothetical protein